MRAYRKKTTGEIEQTTVVEIGGNYYTKLGAPLSPTGYNENLMGWPDDEAEIFQTDLGDIFLIP